MPMRVDIGGHGRAPPMHAIIVRTVVPGVRYATWLAGAAPAGL
jgi:hypothetical protein